MHSSSSGITISSNPGHAAAGTLGANFGESSSRDTFLNDAYVRGAVDFMHSQVRNQGCLVMDINNAGASYEYVPIAEIHESQSFAIALSGLDISSTDAFAYSLGRSLASSAASAGVGLVASRAGLGGFVSTVAASLAGTYVNTNLLPLPRNEQPTNQESRLPSITTNSTVSYERNGNGFQAINLDFDRTELNAAIDKIKEKIFNEALDRGASPQEVAETAQREVENFGQDINAEQEKIDKTVEVIDQTENQLKDEVTESIGSEATRDFKIKDLSPNDRKQVAESLSKAIKKLQKQQAKINLMTPKEQNLVQQASLQAQNEIINEKIQSYSFLHDFLLYSDLPPKLTRSNSADNLIQDTYIRQGQRAIGIGIGGLVELSHEADVLNHQQYVELQRSRLPEDMQNNPDALGRLSVGYGFYKAAAGIGHGLVALDDATGNIVSGAVHKLGEAFEWVGTHTRRFVRDDLGYSQRTAQNLGDATQIAAEIFNPGKVFAVAGAVTKIYGISKFKSALGYKFGLYKGEVSASKIGLVWGKPILGAQGYGMAFENYIATLPEFRGFRLPKNFKTFDFWDRRTGKAISVKTLDTNTAARLTNPNEIYYTLKGYVDKTLEFTGYGRHPNHMEAYAISSREIHLGIPADTGTAQMQQIQRAVEYGRLNNVNIVITRIGK